MLFKGDIPARGGGRAVAGAEVRDRAPPMVTMGLGQDGACPAPPPQGHPEHTPELCSICNSFCMISLT